MMDTSSPVDNRQSLYDVDSSVLKIITPIKRKLRIVENCDPNDDDLMSSELSSNRSSWDDVSSQNVNLSQLSQGSMQNGQFTYYQFRFVFDESFLWYTIEKADSAIDRTCMARSHFCSLQNFKNKPELVIESVASVEIYFRDPQPFIIKFLQYFLNLYSEPSLKNIDDRSIFALYVKFVRNLFILNFSKPDGNWTRSQIMPLLQSSKTAENDLYLFDLMEFNLKCFNFDTISKHVKQATFISTYLFKIVVDFLAKDLEVFFVNSPNYFGDISNVESDLIPILVQMFWPKNNQKPNYTSSTVKMFISKMVKILQLNTAVKSNIDLSCLYSEFCSAMFRLLVLTAECLRIGSGNVRPYLAIYSTRNLVAYELWCRLSHYPMTNNIDFLSSIVEQVKLSPWVCMQFCLQVLNDRYNNLKCTLQTIIGKKIVKAKLSLRMIVTIFLTGDLEEFKVFYLKLARKNLSNCQYDENSFVQVATNEWHKKIKEQLKTKQELVHGQKTVESMEDVYQEFLNKKTVYGGNALHIACRKNDHDAVMRFFKLTRPNQADRFGFTPLIDAVRFGHLECVRAMIDASKKFDVRLHYDAAVGKENGYTALHYAMLNGDPETICMLLKNGGQTLLYIESFDGQTPEDFIGDNDAIRQAIGAIKYNQFENSLPDFKILADERKMEVAENVHYYCLLVRSLIESYLGTIRFHQLELDLFEKNEDDKEQLRIFFREILFVRFSREFARSPSEEEIDRLMDDFQVLVDLDRCVQRFLEHLKTEQKIDDVEFLPFDFQYSNNFSLVRKIFSG